MKIKIFLISTALVIFLNNIQRIKKTFTKPFTKTEKKEYRYLTYITTVCYIGLAFFGLVECLILLETIQPIVTILGLSLYIVGYRVINTAITTLGNSWSLNISAENVSEVVTKNIYSKRRHPYYLGSILWLVGWLLFINAYRTIIGLLILQVPLYLFRIKLEEQELIKKFGQEYINYRKKTHIF